MVALGAADQASAGDESVPSQVNSLGTFPSAKLLLDNVREELVAAPTCAAGGSSWRHPARKGAAKRTAMSRRICSMRPDRGSVFLIGAIGSQICITKALSQLPNRRLGDLADQYSLMGSSQAT